MAKFSPARKIIEYIGGTFNLTLTLNSDETPASGWSIEKFEPSDDTYKVTITSTSTTVCNMSIAVFPNNGTVELHKIFYVVQNSSTSTNPKKFRYSFTVEYNTSKIYQPIWKDIYYTKYNTPQLNYTIYDEENNLIYRGKSIATPDSNDVTFNINKICGNYLSSSLSEDINNRIEYISDYAKLFTIKEINDSVAGEKTIAQYRFYNNYLFDEEKGGIFISDPIRRSNNRTTTTVDVDRRQYMVISAYYKGDGSKEISVNATTLIGGSKIQSIVIDNTAQMVRFHRDSGLKNVVYYTRNSEDTAFNFNLVNTCYEYCLYYVNAYGGWDSLLVDGNVKKVDKIESKYYNRAYSNTTTQFEKKKFTNVITPQYTLHTGWFNDDEQSRLYHLLESTEVYLHNLVTDTIEPVNITNNTCEYKTYTNNGKKKFNNTINVEVAQTKVRMV
jgi:hypothetical protein